VQGRTQKPLMQVSMPHCWELVQARAPGGTARQVPERHMLPVPQSELAVHVVGRRSHVPALHEQLEWQSASAVQAQPGHPKVHCDRSPSVLMMVQPLAASTGTSNARPRKEFSFMGLSLGWSGRFIAASLPFDAGRLENDHRRCRRASFRGLPPV
jgi:hypothetical protein